MPIEYHSNQRGVPGFTVSIVGSSGATNRTVIPAVALVDSAGATIGGGSAAAPTFSQDVGSATLAMGQAATSISPAAATQIVASRTGRQSVTITNVTGTQDIYLTATNVTTGLTTGFMLAGVKGAAITLSTSAAVFATSPTAAQTLSYVESY
jgi:hypothetical protein